MITFLFMRSKYSTLVMLLGYIDDMILSGNSIDGIARVKDFLKYQFFIKNMSKLKFSLKN